MNTDLRGFYEEFALPSIVISTEGGLVLANAAWRALCGTVSAEPWAWTSVVAEDDRDRAHREVQHALEFSRAAEIEFQVHPVYGVTRTVSVAFAPVSVAEYAGLLGVARDVTDERRREERLLFMAGHDPLTGLANRRSFEEALERAASLATTRGVPSMLIMLDMDNLKRCNDVFGHLQGDQALVNLSMLLRTHIRASDLAARIGGDEFGLLLSGATLADAGDIAERICVAAKGEFVAGAREADLGVSGGIVAIDGDVEPRVALDRADAAMYAAKQGGRHQFVTWDAELGELATSDSDAARVRDGLGDPHGVSLVYQPIVSLKDGSVSYYEALARMNGSTSDVMMPVEFLPIVERLGLMPRLTLRVLDLAIAALAENPGVSLSVNLSAADILDTSLLEEIEASVRAMKTPRGSLLFEIAENTLLGNLGVGRNWMERLSGLGCRLVLDEFGTGLGVFVLLREAQVEQVKLSREFIGTLRHSTESRAFVRAVREVIESQGKSTVAAFIETDRMLADVQEAGFEFSQGYALCEPGADLAELARRMGAARRP